MIWMLSRAARRVSPGLSATVLVGALFLTFAAVPQPATPVASAAGLDGNRCETLVAVGSRTELRLVSASRWETDSWADRPPAQIGGPGARAVAKWSTHGGFARGCGNNARYDWFEVGKAGRRGSIDFSVAYHFDGTFNFSCTTSGERLPCRGGGRRGTVSFHVHSPPTTPHIRIQVGNGPSGIDVFGEPVRLTFTGYTPQSVSEILVYVQGYGCFPTAQQNRDQLGRRYPVHTLRWPDEETPGDFLAVLDLGHLARGIHYACAYLVHRFLNDPVTVAHASASFTVH